ncbi:thioredoxin-domain-containing protein [Polychaeton citri CBS 116435]|uniref:Thioredoxin-domain-containing protein n=1 Tax=Polychaeton citri CBS 116435 TaxID=1314669 RepID=A0A9P4QFE1_9PEZI|nr:thioredoxin-domain-containing protein [Polychaeton citri CBS 116435]
MSSTTALRRSLLTTSRFSPATAPRLAATTTAAAAAPRLFSSAVAHQQPPQAFRHRQLSTPATTLPPLPPTKRNFSSTMADEGVHNLSSKADFDEALNEKGSLMVLDCFATWCGPCKIIAPKVVGFSKSYSNARFFKLDVDEVPEVAQELSVRAMPTFLLFKDGQKVAEVVGANPVALEAAIKQHA